MEAGKANDSGKRWCRMSETNKSGALIVRHLYLDEAGIGNPEIEPYTVVGGIAVHVDNQYDSLQKYLLDMADDLVAPSSQRPSNFCFHATALWHGNGFFHRDKGWTRPRRMEILRYLADIPEKFELPIIYSCLERATFCPASVRGKERRIADRKAHATAFLSTLTVAERWMEEKVPHEKIFAVVELHENHKKGLERVADVMTDPRAAEEIEKAADFHWRPLRRFADAPLMTPKSGKSPLQVADVCAFILSRALADRRDNFYEDNQDLFQRIEPLLVTGFRKDFVKLVYATKGGAS
jgi:hypothetical protein